MSLIKRQFEVATHFGPVIVKSKISTELSDILLNTAYKIRNDEKLKKENDYRKNVGGHITEIYSYKNSFTSKEEKIVDEELSWLASMYTKFADKKLERPDLVKEPKDIIIQKPIQVNFMKEAEWVPSHIHTGDISCVMFLKVPKEIDDENTTGEHAMYSKIPSAGRIEFCYGEDIVYCRTAVKQTPMCGDIYFFPAKMQHMVYPFISKTERISVNLNFFVRNK